MRNLPSYEFIDFSSRTNCCCWKQKFRIRYETLVERYARKKRREQQERLILILSNQRGYESSRRRTYKKYIEVQFLILCFELKKMNSLIFLKGLHKKFDLQELNSYLSVQQLNTEAKCEMQDAMQEEKLALQKLEKWKPRANFQRKYAILPVAGLLHSMTSENGYVLLFWVFISLPIFLLLNWTILKKQQDIKLEFKKKRLEISRKYRIAKEISKDLWKMSNRWNEYSVEKKEIIQHEYGSVRTTVSYQMETCRYCHGKGFNGVFGPCTQ